MSPRVKLFTALASIVALSSACADDDAQGPDPTAAGVEEVGDAPLRLSLAQGSARGSLAVDGETLAFESVPQGEGVYELTLKVREVTLDATIDFANRTSSFDGFGSKAGDDRLLADEDRELVARLYRALNDRAPAPAPEAFKVLRRAVGVWAEHPVSVPLDRLVYGDEGRGYTMLCSYAKCGGSFTGACTGWNWFNYAKHDCNRGGFGSAINQQSAQLGDHYSCGGDEFYYNNGWVCGEPDHFSRPSVVGNCFGRCGGGCGGDTQYTLDATNHDGCVRNGHVLASGYCDDQFVSASDDELFAPDCY